MSSMTLTPPSVEIDPMAIRRLLICLGVNMSYKGFEPCVYAVQLAGQDPGRLQSVFKSLYMDIADRFAVSLTDVERNIRTIVKAAWENNPELLNRLAGRLLPCRPTASQFIALLAFYFLNATEACR